MSWVDQKAQFLQRFTTISQYAQNQLPKDQQALATATANYIEAGGISNDPSTDVNHQTIVQTAKTINGQVGEMLQLNSDIAAYVQSYAQNNDMNALLSENGKLQQSIKSLEKEKKAIAEDAEGAQLRDQLLRTQDTDITAHQVFLLGRPLRPASIPYIWALSVLFIGIGLLLFASIVPLPYTSFDQFSFDIGDTFQKPLVWGTILASTLITIVVLSLSAAGVFKS